MKEAQMINPNSLGHYHRDIKSARIIDRFYMELTLSCGHKTDMSRASYKKYSNDATLCIKCTNMEGEEPWWGSKTEFINGIDTWNSGGNVMLDIIHLKSGQVLVISDEVVCKYESLEQFINDNGEYDYDNNSIELFDPREMKNVV